jgi:hypothetical protein
VVHQLGDCRPTAVNNRSIYGCSVAGQQSEVTYWKLTQSGSMRTVKMQFTVSR